MNQKFSKKIISIIVLVFILIALFLFFQKKISSHPNSVTQNNLSTENRSAKLVENLSDRKNSTVKISSKIINVDLAATEETRVRGLSGRTSLEADQGMLFIFENPDKYGIWMKDMLFAIDIIWIDDKNTIISAEKNVLPETYPKIFLPSSPARYVLELPAGFLSKENVSVGDKVEIRINP